MTEPIKTIDVLRLAYVALLGMPYDLYRAQHQRTLSMLRDKISELTGEDPEAVQNGHEALAAYFGGVMINAPEAPASVSPKKHEDGFPYS